MIVCATDLNSISVNKDQLSATELATAHVNSYSGGGAELQWGGIENSHWPILDQWHLAFLKRRFLIGRLAAR